MRPLARIWERWTQAIRKIKLAISDTNSQTVVGAPSFGTIDFGTIDNARYLTRQPILDRRGNVFAYQFTDHERASAPRSDTPGRASHPILDTLALFGLERLAGGTTAFIRCMAQELVDGLMVDLPARNIVLEIGKDTESSPKLLQSCTRLKAAGFRFAFRDFANYETARFPLSLLDYVTVNSDDLETGEWERLCRILHGASAAIIADRVHTQAAYRQCRAVGINYFQGFYFWSPVFIHRSRVPANRLHHVEILKELFKDPLDLKTLCPLVMRDASLVYRVLRYVNSPLCAVRNPVHSLHAAIVILGDATFRRIATLAIECALNQNQPPEILQMALVRARFCELAASTCGLASDEQYLLGLLSLLPAMLRVPMETIVPELPLTAGISRALRGESVTERCLLSWIERLERNEIDGCEALSARYGLDRGRLSQLYLDALDSRNQEPMGA
jgi:EAL and modified HD-GYP domain-containing signal transduction protein